MTTNARVDAKIRISKKDVDFNNTTQIERSLRNIVNSSQPSKTRMSNTSN